MRSVAVAAWWGLLGCLVVCASAPVRAADDDAAKAGALYRKATAHYAVGEFEQAAVAYQDAYVLKPDPALLYNAAQCYRLAGNSDRALTIYRNYLRLYPNATNASEVRAHIAKLEQQAASRPAPPAPAPAPSAPPPVTEPAATPPPPALGPPPVPTPVIATPPAAPVNIETGAAPPAKPLYQRGWFWGAVGGVTAVAVVAIVVATHSGGGSWNNLPDVQQRALGAEALRW